MKLTLLFTLILLSAYSHGVLAQQNSKDNPIDKWLEKCLNDDSNRDAMSMNVCYAEAVEKWDKELNKIYQALMKILPKNAKDSLKSAQKAWLKFRDEEFKLIDAAYAQKEGSIWSNTRAEQSMLVVRSRALVLKTYLDTLEDE